MSPVYQSDAVFRRDGDRSRGSGQLGLWNRWWEEEDSNLRRLSRRFYRPLPLAARASSRWTKDSNRRFDTSTIGCRRGQAGLLVRHRLRSFDARGRERGRPDSPRDRPAVRLQGHRDEHQPGRQADRGPLLDGGPAEGGRRGPEGEGREAAGLAEGPAFRAGPAGRQGSLAAVDQPERRDLRREG